MSDASKKLIGGMAKKDADTIEKFVLRVIDKSLELWAARTNKAMKRSTTLGSSGREADEHEKKYNHAFRQWHLLQQLRNNVEKWLDPSLKVPSETSSKTGGK